MPAAADVLPVKVSVSERLPLTDVYCVITPVGNPLIVTAGVPLGPVILTGSWTVAPSCGTTTVVLPREMDRFTGGVVAVTLPPPQPTAASANPIAAMSRIERNDRSVKSMDRPRRTNRLLYWVD